MYFYIPPWLWYFFVEIAPIIFWSFLAIMFCVFVFRFIFMVREINFLLYAFGEWAGDKRKKKKTNLK